MLIEATTRFGCRGRGIELDPALADEARKNVSEAGLGDRIEIVEADASGEQLGRFVADADIVFLFLPVEVTQELLGDVLGIAPVGARVVAHEQAPLATPIQPTESRLVIGHGLTVAYRWQHD